MIDGQDFLCLQLLRTEKLVASGYYDHRPSTSLGGRPRLTTRIEDSRNFPILAEVKLASPSTGTISSMTVTELIDAYAEGGATGLSILTEPSYFQGNLTFMESVKVLDLPVLMKDFFIAEQQIEAAKAYGASAILLIQGIFNAPGRIGERDGLIAMAHELGLEVVLEGHTENELAGVMDSEADVLGINQRDLHDLSVRRDQAVRMLPLLNREERPIMVMSGIRTRADIMQIRDAGGNAVLIGTELAASGDPKTRLRQLGVPR